MSIPAKTDCEPLELFTKGRDVVIFVEIKYEPYEKILEALKVSA